jgi:hypothetical protein
MLMNTRRRMLGLLAAAVGASRLLPPYSRAFAKTAECFALQPFGEWKGVATNSQCGARIGQVTFTNADSCDLRAEIQIAANFDGKLVVYGDPEATRLPKKFLIQPDNRLIVRTEGGKEAVNEALCGNCTDIFDDKVSIVLPLACAPLLRESKTLEMAIKLGEKEECRFTLNCEDLRKALDWASERQGTLATSYDSKACTPPAEGCFITTACCEVLGLTDDCFELNALRHYRDRVLAGMPGGKDDIALYRRIAPSILERLPEQQRVPRLLSVHARFILPSAMAARLGRNRLAYRLYARMMRELTREFAPELRHR